MSVCYHLPSPQLLSLGAIAQVTEAQHAPISHFNTKGSAQDKTYWSPNARLSLKRSHCGLECAGKEYTGLELIFK